MTKFRTWTDTGHHYELDAADYLAAVEDTHRREAEAGTRADRRITSLWYFNRDLGQWVSGDELLSEGTS